MAQPRINGPLNTPELLQAFLDSCPPDLEVLLLQDNPLVSLNGMKFPDELVILDLR